MRLGRKLELGIAALAAAGVVFLLMVYLCNPAPLKEARLYPSGILLRDRDGQLLRVGLGPGDLDCRPYYVPSTNDWIVQATIAAEDRKFWRHRGVDWTAAARALSLNVRHGETLSGASTITMQAVRLIRPRKRTLWAKLVETAQAIHLERAMSKREILAQYMNRAPFGSNLAGAEAGALGWFGKEPGELNLGEAALLAGMLQSPTRFRPDRFPARAKERRAYVLDRMKALGMITDAERARAEAVPLRLRREPRPFREPWFCDWAMSFCPRRSGDWKASLDSALQARVNAALAQAARDQKADFAAVAIDVRSGEVRAMACTGDYFGAIDGQVNTATSARPAGSTLKPFVYAMALDGGIIEPRTMLLDAPMAFGNEEPQNFSGSFLGPVSARDALVLSLNIPAIALENRLGLRRFYGTLGSLGFGTLDRPAETYGLGLALGNGSVRLVDLANAYACLAREGEWRAATPFIASDGAGGADGIGAPPGNAGARRIFSKGACWLVAEMLSGGERALAAVGHQAEAKTPRFAWKTGTSSGFRDAWTVAWNPDWTVGVWCGYKNGQRSDEQLIGKKSAAPVAWEIIRALCPNGEGTWFKRPDDVEEREVCAESGAAPTPWCKTLVRDWALRGRTSCALCTMHADGKTRKADAPQPGIAAAATAQFRIVKPSDGTTFRCVDGVRQQVAFKIEGVKPGERIWWFCDGALAGETAGNEMWFWEPVAGRHRISAANASGGSSSVTLRIEGG